MTKPPPATSHGVSRSVVLWFLLTASILGGLAFTTTRGIQSLVENRRWVSHTHQVLTNLHDTCADLGDLHASQRGFLLTGHQDYMASYRAVIPSLTRNLRQLRQLVADNPDQLERQDALDREVRNRLKKAALVLDTFEANGLEAAVVLLRASEVRQEISTIRALIQDMEEAEEQLLGKRESAANRSADWVLVTGIAGLAACASILAFVFWLVRREGVRRQVTEASLQEANVRLEESFRRLERLTEETVLITTMGDYMQTCRSPQDAYAILGRTLPRLLPAISGAIGIISNSRNLVEMVLTWGEGGVFTKEFHPDECWGLRRGRLHHVADAEGSHPLCGHLVRGTPPGYLCLPMVAHGETLGLLCLSTPREGGLGDAERATARAVAEQASLALANLRLQEALRVQSIRDPLTGLFNRRYLEASLEREVLRAKRQGQPVAVMMLDIDHFKRFNDTFGHDGGDALLSEFGKLIARHFRGEDVPCRFGGEEFCVLLPGADLEVARQRAEELREAVKRMNVRHGKTPLGPVTMSAGVAVYPGHGETGESVVTAADSALYRAKHAGRDRVVVCELEPAAPLVVEPGELHRNGTFAAEVASN